MKFKMIAFFFIVFSLLICVCCVPVNEMNVSVKANGTEIYGTFTGTWSALKGKNGTFTAADGWIFEGIINPDGGLWKGELTDFPISEEARASSVFELPAYYTGAVEESTLVDLKIKGMNSSEKQQ